MGADADFKVDDVFTVTRAMLAELPYAQITHDAVARRAEVEARALAERWPCPSDLVMDALLAVVDPVPEELPDDSSLRAELLFLASWLARDFAAHGEQIVRIMSQVRDHPELDRAFHERFLLPRIACARKVFGRAMLRGDLRPEIDPRLLFNLVPALMTYRVLLRAPTPDTRLAELLVDTVLLPLMVRPETR